MPEEEEPLAEEMEDRGLVFETVYDSEEFGEWGEYRITDLGRLALRVAASVEVALSMCGGAT